MQTEFKNGFETGEYVVKSQHPIHDLQPYYIIPYIGDYIYDINGSGTSLAVNQHGYKYNGIYSSVTFICCNEQGFSYLMPILSLETNSSNILTIFTVPKLAVRGFDRPTGTTNTWDTYGFEILEYNNFSQNYPVNTFSALSTSDDFEGYVPKNKKLLSYPFTYLGFNPPTGSKKVFRFEDFHENTPEFEVISEINPNPTICVLPVGYRRKNKAYVKDLTDMCTINGYPSISYKNDTFNNWMAQNSNILSIAMSQEQTNYQHGFVNNVAGLVQNASSHVTDFNNKSDALSAINDIIIDSATRGINQAFSNINHEYNVAMQMAQVEKQQMLPDTAVLSGNNSSLLGYGLEDECIFTTYCIKREFAERIDQFFDMYGYKTNMLKIPNLNNRPNWNYVKTAGCNILADIPQQDLQTIKDLFDNGITLWHNPTTFLDYSQNNR